MGIKISDLTSATSLTGSEELPIVQSGNTKKTTIENVRALKSFSYTIAGAGASATNKTANSWQEWASTTQTDLIPAGIYLMICEYSYQGTGNTAQLTIGTTIDTDFTRKARSTGALIGTAFFSVVGATCITFTSESTHTLKLEGYGTAVWKEGETNAITFIKIGEYVATRGNVEQLRSTNNGDLVGIGDRAEVNENEIIEDTPIDEKQEEIKEDAEEPIANDTEVKESGENDELR